MATNTYPAAYQDLAIGTNPPGYHAFSGYDPRRRWIIIHGTGGGSSAIGTAQYFKEGPHSTHFVIDRAGPVVQCVSLNDSAWGNAPTETGAAAWWWQFVNPNFVTISIELVNPDPQNGDGYTAPQLHSLFVLVQWLCQTFNIPPVAATAQGGITGHYSIDPVDRSQCPGSHFPWSDLWSFLHPTQPVIPVSILPPGWEDDTTNGILYGQSASPPDAATEQRYPIVRGFRHYLLSHPDTLHAIGSPIEAEHQVADVGADGVHGAGVRQIFRMGALGWTEKEDVFPLWTGFLWKRDGHV